jgi:hypothetical protein
MQPVGLVICKTLHQVVSEHVNMQGARNCLPPSSWEYYDGKGKGFVSMTLPAMVCHWQHAIPALLEGPSSVKSELQD